jgi:hypothetical protein
MQTTTLLGGKLRTANESFANQSLLSEKKKSSLKFGDSTGYKSNVKMNFRG